MATTLREHDSDIPPMLDSFGQSAGADAAFRALDENEQRDDNEKSVAGSRSEDGDAKSDAATSETIPLATTEESARGGRNNASSPSSDTVSLDGAAKPDKLSARKVKRLPRRVLEDRYLVLHERAAQLETDNADLNRRAAVVQAVGIDVIDDGVKNMVGELLDVADNTTQLLVPKHLAKVVALDADERERLVKLAAPLAKMQLGKYVEKSPQLAFLLALASITLGKVVAYKLAQSDHAEA
jgi:hypothetical protein